MSNTKTCIHCSIRINNHLRFCPNCGGEQETGVTVSQSHIDTPVPKAKPPDALPQPIKNLTDVIEKYTRPFRQTEYLDKEHEDTMFDDRAPESNRQTSSTDKKRMEEIEPPTFLKWWLKSKGYKLVKDE